MHDQDLSELRSRYDDFGFPQHPDSNGERTMIADGYKKEFKASDRDRFVKDFATQFMAGYAVQIYHRKVWDTMVEIGEVDKAN
jgi:hypothetical protein